jgi:hypothetical protein
MECMRALVGVSGVLEMKGSDIGQPYFLMWGICPITRFGGCTVSGGMRDIGEVDHHLLIRKHAFLGVVVVAVALEHYSLECLPVNCD